MSVCVCVYLCVLSLYTPALAVPGCSPHFLHTYTHTVKAQEGTKTDILKRNRKMKPCVASFNSLL